MGCDKLKVYVPQDGPYGLEPEEGGEPVEEETCYLKSDVDAVIAELKDERDAFEKSFNEMTEAFMQSQRALWLMTAEWAEAMGLASCNIASKFMSRERFEVSEDYRNITIKKYRHRQVVFYKYADYCRQKAEEYK